MPGFGSMAPYDPMFPAPEDYLPDVGAPLIPSGPTWAGKRMANRIFGTGPEERVQLWPEKLVRSALTLPGDIASGAQPMLPPGLRREDYTDIPAPQEHGAGVEPGMFDNTLFTPQAAQPNDPAYMRAQDTAGIAGGGMMFGSLARPAGAALGRDVRVLGRKVGSGEPFKHQLIDQPEWAHPSAVYDGPMGPAGNASYDMPTMPQFTPKYRPHGAADARIDAELGLHANDAGLTVVQNTGRTLLEDSAVPGAPIAALENAPKFYSALERTIGQIAQPRMTAEQWAGTLANRGVKPEEMQWRGVNDFLEQRRGQPVTKEEIVAHLDQNKVELGEVHRGEMQFDKSSPYALPEVVRAAREAGDTPGDLELVLANDGNAYRALTKKFPELSGKEDWAEIVSKSVFGGDTMPAGTTKYHSYQLPGGENYREKLLTLPVRKRADGLPEGYSIREEGPGRFSYRGPGIGSQIFPTREAALADAVRTAGQMGNEGLYRSSHWDEPNVLAHRRSNERTFEVPFTPEEQAAASRRAELTPQMEKLRADQATAAKVIQTLVKPLERARQTQIREDMKAGRITGAEGLRRMEEVVEYPEIAAAQRHLQELRAQEDALRASMPAEPKPKNIRALHIEEIQSDWHQAGRKQGYRGSPDVAGWTAKEGAGDPASGPVWEVRDANGRWIVGIPREKGVTAEQAIKRAASSERGPDYSRVPDAPFKKNWHELALKDAIREAAEKDMDRISWTPGEAQAARYDLSKQVEKIGWAKRSDGTYDLSIHPKGRGRDGEAINYDKKTPDEMASIIGKEATEKITSAPGEKVSISGYHSAGDLVGPDLKVGGEGMKGFYDKMIPDALNKIGKAHGVKVQKGAIKDRDKGPLSGSAAMDRMTGKPGWEDIPAREEGRGEWFSNLDHQRRESLFEQARDIEAPVHYMDIPQSLKDEVLKKGFSLFEDSATAGAPLAALEAGARSEGPASAYHSLIDPPAGAAPSQTYGAMLDQPAGSAYNPAHGTETAAARESAPAPRGDGSGGAGGGDARLHQAAAEAARRAGAEKPLEGLPTKAMKIGDEYFVPGPIAKVREVAADYMANRETPSYHKPPEKYHPLDEEHSKSIARAFDEMKHDPENPAVKASYDALINETIAQYKAIEKTGLKIEPITPDMPDPYAANPRLAAKDVADNNHLWYFPTDQGFGSNPAAGIDMAKHPMMRPTGIKMGDRELLANDLFRIVHDYFGHLKEGYGFRAAGEDNAWRSHASMYSDLARPAMTTETRGQNSWVNYGPHGESNRKASAADTKYADQKVGLMPEWTMRDRGSPEPTIAYHASPYSFDKFSMEHLGKGEGAQAYGEGLYFAGHEPVSEWYRHQLSARRDPLLKKYNLDSEQGANLGMMLAAENGDMKKVISSIQQSLDELVAERAAGRTDKATQNMIKDREAKIAYLKDPNRAKGHMYQVAIDAPPEKFLDWDAPLQEQPKAVQEWIAKHPKAGRLQGPDVVKGQLKNPTGEAIFGRLRAVSDSPEKELSAAGLAGIRYLDQLSRSLGGGTSNYVTFSAPRVLKKYAVPGAIGAGGFGMMAREEQ